MISTQNRTLIVLLTVWLLQGCGPVDSNTAAAQSASQTTLFSGARILVGDGEVIDRGALLIQGSTILAVGAEADIEAPAEVTVVDVRGRTIMPTMIDAHAHLGYEGYSSWGGKNYSRETLIDHLNRYAYYGFSAVFSAGSDPDELALQLAEDQRNGRVGGAQFLFAAGMGPPGQGPNDRFLTHALAIQDSTGMTVLRGLTDPQQARAMAREVSDKGIPFIKIWVDDRGGSQDKLGPALYRPLIEEARRQGIKVFVHQQFASDMPDLLDAGVDGFLHGRLGTALDGPLAEQIAASGAFLVPNLGLGELRRERVASDSFLQEIVPQSVVDRLGDSFDQRPQATVSAEQEQILRVSMGQLLEAGVDILLGTDAGAVPDHFFGYTGHRELEIFVRLGMTPAQAIEAATSKPARRLGLDELGTLEPGKRADFIVLAENPLDDIRNTRSITRVYQRGSRVERDSMRDSWLAAAAR
ncbi:MAG: amidohydrolase family protein [Gammaproteobacteria bacterium]|nr:amidohydrolase family protein [Gammaproteobacteria bacterium]